MLHDCNNVWLCKNRYGLVAAAYVQAVLGDGVALSFKHITASVYLFAVSSLVHNGRRCMTHSTYSSG